MELLYSSFCVSDLSLHPTAPSAGRSGVRTLNALKKPHLRDVFLPESDKTNIKRACHQLLI